MWTVNHMENIDEMNGPHPVFINVCAKSTYIYMWACRISDDHEGEENSGIERDI